MKKRSFKFIVFFVVLSVVISSALYARKKGNIHYRAKCQHAACHCTEFVSDADSYYKCYNCGHADYVHKK